MIDIADIKNDIESSQAQMRKLQAETIHAIAIKPSGKIEVVDKERLEGLNAEIDRLTALVDHNSKVLEKAVGALGSFPSLSAARERRAVVDSGINRTNGLLRIDIAALIKSRPDIDPGNPYAHPEAKKLKDGADKDLARSMPELKRLDELIRLAEAIIADFQPSGLRPMEITGAHAITRESVAGFGL